MTPGELRELVRHADIYKMSLGKSARFRAEAQDVGVLVFHSETSLYDAVVEGNPAEIQRVGRTVRAELYPTGGGPDGAISVWKKTIETFRTLPRHSLIIHWEADLDHIHWSVSDSEFRIARRENNDFGQAGYVFHRDLVGGWRKTSIGGVPLSNIHPKARGLAINMATLNRVQTDTGYFRALLLDLDTSEWERRPDWQLAAAAVGWHRKPVAEIRASRRQKTVTDQVREIRDHFLEEVRRMAATATHTAAYANGQTAIVTIKEKTIDFSREELEDEIEHLLRQQGYCCALTGYDFRDKSSNPHLRPSLDRKDSRIGYVAGNLQIVTRAANFFKSASDDADWQLKLKALEFMAFASQAKRKHKPAADQPLTAPATV